MNRHFETRANLLFIRMAFFQLNGTYLYSIELLLPRQNFSRKQEEKRNIQSVSQFIRDRPTHNAYRERFKRYTKTIFFSLHLVFNFDCLFSFTHFLNMLLLIMLLC